MLPVMIFLGLIMVFLAGMRWETGTDWPNYLQFFNNIEKIPLWHSHMEIGYEFLVRAFKALFDEKYTPFLFFCAAFIVFFTYKATYKQSPYPIFSLFLLLSYSLVGSGFGVRQDLSISLTLLSLTFIQQRSFYKFAFLIFIASLIHNSAIIFFPAYYLYTLKWNLLTVLIFIGVILLGIFLSESLMSTFGSMVSERKTELYMELGTESTEDPYSSLVKGLSGRFLFFLICVPLVSYKDRSDPHYNGVFNIYVFGIIIYALFTPLNLVFSRLARPYDIFQILIIPLAYVQANRFYKLIIIAIIFAFSIFKFSTTIRSDAGVFVPYKTVLDK